MMKLISTPFMTLIALACTLLTGCLESGKTNLDDQGARSSAFAWEGVPKNLPLPLEPAENPMTEAKFQLGRHLFYDEDMSARGNIACATCHHQEKAFTDGLDRPRGTHDDQHARNAQPLQNTAWFATFNWSSPEKDTLEVQIRGPLFNIDNPIPEHGITDDNIDQILADLLAKPTYQELFAEAFPEKTEDADWNFDDHIIPALASFIRGITSFDAPYDRYLLGDRDAITASARRGLALFQSERLECFHCHLTDHFQTNNRMDRSMTYARDNFHNTGAVERFDEPNRGLYETYPEAYNFGRFRTPSLRNIALTAPYSHDGSQDTLRDVITTYSTKGKCISNCGIADGSLSPGFTLSESETRDLLSFLCSLTDETFITNPRYSNPWPDEAGNLRPIPENPDLQAQCH